MLAVTRQHRSLRDLIQAQLSDLTSDDVPGVAVMLPHLKRVDVYTTLGTNAEKTSEFFKSLTWVLAKQSGEGWACYAVDDELRDRFINELTGK
jgi:hypothetical protein